MMLWIATPKDVQNLYPLSRVILLVLIIVLSIFGLRQIISLLKAENNQRKRLENAITLEQVNSTNKTAVCRIKCDDIPAHFSPKPEAIISMAEYSTNYGGNCACFAIKYSGRYVGVMALGEMLKPHDMPDSLTRQKHYCLQGLLIDSRYHRIGIGSAALGKAIDTVFGRYGDLPVVARCHKDNEKAIEFLKKNDFAYGGTSRQDDNMQFFIF